MRARTGRGLIIQFLITFPCRLRRAIGHHGAGFVTLVHFDAMTVEFIILEGNGFAQRLALCGGLRIIIFQLGHIGLHLLGVFGRKQAESLKNRPEFSDGLIGAGHDLLGDRRAFRIIAGQQAGRGLPLEHIGNFPGQIPRVLNRSI